MKVVFVQGDDAEKVKLPTKAQQYHTDMLQALRRRQFIDFQTAQSDPEVIEAVANAQKVSPGWQPKFRK